MQSKMKSTLRAEGKTQTEIWEEEHSRVLSKCSPELLKIVGKHSTLWNYSKLETMEKLSELLAQVEAKAVERAIQAVITELRNAIWQEKETIHGRVVEFSEERFLKAFKLARQALQKDTI